MKILDNPNESSWSEIVKRPEHNYESVNNIVQEVFTNVKESGDVALRDYTSKFDNVSLSSFAVDEKEFVNAEKEVAEELKQAIKLARRNIETFHSSQIYFKQFESDRWLYHSII